MFNGKAFELADAAAPSTKNAGMIYEVGDVDSEYLRLRDLGITDAPPTNKPWGVRSFTVKDPDGNGFSFFQHL